jgi:dynactin complex subunit
LDTTVKKILDASNAELWIALKATLDVERERKLSIIIDGLDEEQQQGSKPIRGVYSLVTHLQKRPSKLKILLTSGPQAAIKEVNSRLLCIEYDKERKGLARYLKTLNIHSSSSMQNA